MKAKNSPADFKIRCAEESDCELILSFIKELAEYEKLSHEVIATPSTLKETLFCEKPAAQVLIGEFDDQVMAYALFFYNFSSFTGRSGIYLEDIYVKPEMRGKGFGKSLLASIARRAVEENCTRFEWSVLDWNEPSIKFYRSIGAIPMDGWTVQRLAGEALISFAEKF